MRCDARARFGTAWLRSAAVALALLAACLHDNAQQCAEGKVCPAGLACAKLGDQEICVLASCGDGKVGTGEICDDGNRVSGDGCPVDCSAPCGDGALDPGEVCDDGNIASGDHCSADCTSLERCGNGIVDPGEACDDGGLRSRDGCSARCQAELPLWAALDSAPPPRAGHAMAYDTARGVVVLFGGRGARGVLDDTWEWDGATWHRRTPATVPPARADHAMAYDAARRRVVMFGAVRDEANLWEWDGIDWRARQAPTAPPYLVGVAMAYDAARSRALVFGGKGDAFPFYENELWSWDGDAWHQLAKDPVGRAGAMMSYDSRRGTTLLFGGVTYESLLLFTTIVLSSAWEFDGASWASRSDPQEPPARAHAAMAFDASNGSAVMFGGADGFDTDTADTWIWDGSQWTNPTTAVAPPPRRGAAMVYDALRGRALLFGGQQSFFDNVTRAGLMNDTWSWDGTAWRELTVRAELPRPRDGFALAGHSITGRTILFGGRLDDGTDLDDTWAWDGRGWIAYRAPNHPPPRRDAAMAMDTRALVLFGGVRGSGATAELLNDTWTMPDMEWVRRALPNAPSPRTGSALTSDGSREGLLLFGGSDRNGALSDTWRWAGDFWIRLAPVHAPPARSHAAMLYHRQGRRVVLFGGVDGAGAALADTWTWDGSDWTQRQPASVPPAGPHAMFLDRDSQLPQLFAGDETWEWDGNDWQRSSVVVPAALNDRTLASTADGVVALELVDGHSDPTRIWLWSERAWHGAVPHTGAPPARSRAAIAYDPLRGAAVMFGGVRSSDRSTPVRSNDTWSWTGTGWRALTPAAAPPPRSGHAMAHDGARRRTVLFGGTGDGGPTDDTWEWDGATWIARAPSRRPGARTGSAMAYDAARGRTVLIGGSSSAGSVLGDQWSWDGDAWSSDAPAMLPPPRTDLAIAYDAARQRIVVFGGHDGRSELGDVWEWDGATWRDRTPVSGAGPAPRRGHALIYDAARARVVLHGGRGGGGALDDVWEWDGASWSQVIAPGPRARAFHAMAYDSARMELVVFGGDDGAVELRDTWLLRRDDRSGVEEVCRTGFDGDGDGAIGCADADCSELCALCGNGACDGAESCRVCPDDCGVCRLCGDAQCDAGESCASCPGDCGACE